MLRYDFKPIENKSIINNENKSYLTISKSGIGLSTAFVETEKLTDKKLCIVLNDTKNKALAITFKVYDKKGRGVHKVSGDPDKKYRRISIDLSCHDWVKNGRYIPEKEEFYYVIDFTKTEDENPCA